MNNGDLYFRIDDGTLYLSSDPNGKVPVRPRTDQYGVLCWPWTDSRDITKVVIEDRIALPVDASGFFCGIDGVTDIEGLENLDTTSVTYMDHMFYGCSSLTSLDLSSFDTSSVTDACYAFAFCTSLKSLDLSGWDMGHGVDMFSMLLCCGSLKAVTASDERIINEVPDNIKVVHPTTDADRDAAPTLGDTLDQFAATADALQAAVTALQGNIADMREAIGRDRR